MNHPSRSSPGGRLLLLLGPLLLGVLLLGPWLAGCAGGEPESPPDPRLLALERMALLRPAADQGLRPFFLDRFEVTRAEYRRFLGPGIPERFRSFLAQPLSPGEAVLPMVGVSPGEAEGYARWRGCRLPRLKEWEVAVGVGADGRDTFPWGEAFDAVGWDELKCNTAELHLHRLTPVGTFPLGATRGDPVYDLIGNAAEWVRWPVTAGPSKTAFRIRVNLVRRHLRWLAPGLIGPEVEEALDLALFHRVVQESVLAGQAWLPPDWPPRSLFVPLADPPLFPRLGERLSEFWGNRVWDLKYQLREEGRFGEAVVVTMAGGVTPLSFLDGLVRRHGPPLLRVWFLHPGQRVLTLVRLRGLWPRLKRLLVYPCRAGAAGVLRDLAKLTPEESGALARPYAWVGWDYTSIMERHGYSIPGRVSPRQGSHASCSTVGFRLAAYPEEILHWLLDPEGPPLDGASGRVLARFLERHGELFRPHLPAAAGGKRARRIRRLLP